MKEQNPKDFPNIIFDYGGVILNIDVRRTVDAFLRLIPLKEVDIQEKVESSDIFKKLEKGLVEENHFLEGFNDLLQSNLEWKDFEPAWNAMIGDIPISRLDMLEKVSGSHQIFLLSNTNSIHLQRVNQVVFETIGEPSIDHYFKKAYYSNYIGMRKPDTEIYEFVLKENGLDPRKTIFLDDNIHNLRGAAQAGLAVCHISEERGIMELF